MTFPASSRCFAGCGLCRPGLAFPARLCSPPCAPTRNLAAEFFVSSSLPASVKRGRTTPFLFTSSSAFFISRLGSSLQATSLREGVMVEAAAPVKGTRPEGAVSEADASKKVREMFTQIAPRYDLLNHLLSLQLHRLWRPPPPTLLHSPSVRPYSLVVRPSCATP